MREFASTYTMGLGLAASLVAATGVPAIAQGPAPARAMAPVDRTILPIAPPQHAPITELDARKATPPPRFEVKAPRGPASSARDRTSRCDSRTEDGPIKGSS